MPRVPDMESRNEETLENARLRIQAEINAYPAPIPACDVYFNSLLEQRSRVSEVLAALRRSQAAC